MCDRLPATRDEAEIRPEVGGIGQGE